LQGISHQSNLSDNIKVVLNFLVIVSGDSMQEHLADLFGELFILVAKMSQNFSKFLALDTLFKN
jgi:hypothetical protein